MTRRCGWSSAIDASVRGMVLLVAAGLGVCCREAAESSDGPRQRPQSLAPAARGALGAYAKSGRTPWTDRTVVPTPDGGPVLPFVPRVPARDAVRDGGVAL
jgi:hypothetical protein